MKDKEFDQVKDDNFLGNEENEKDISEYPSDKAKEENYLGQEENKIGGEDNKVNSGDKKENSEAKSNSSEKKSEGQKESGSNVPSSTKIHAITMGATSAVVAIVAVSSIISTGIFKKDPKFDYIKAEMDDQAHIYYSFAVTNTDSMPLKVVMKGLTSDYSKTVDVSLSGAYDDSFSDLKSHQGYKFSIVGQTDFGSKTYYAKTFNTGEYQPYEYFNGITWKCQCTIDGFAYYTLDYEDDMNYWSYFYVLLTSTSDSTLTYDWNVDKPYKNVTHKIDVSAYKGGEYTFALYAKSSDPSSLGKVIKLYTTTVNI